MADALLRSLGHLVRKMTDQTGDMVFLDIHGRVAKLLIKLAGDPEEDLSSPIELPVCLTQSDLASMVGGSRQSVNQIVRALEDRGFVELDGRKIILKDLAALRRRARLD